MQAQARICPKCHDDHASGYGCEADAADRLTDAIATSDKAAERASGHAMEAILALIPQHPER